MLIDIIYYLCHNLIKKHMKTQYFFIAFLFFIIFNSCQNYETEMPKSVIHIKMPKTGFYVEVGDTIYLNPQITYDYGSTYSWTLNNELIYDTRRIRLIIKELGLKKYKFTVNNNRGKDSIVVDVTGVYNNNFNNLTLKNNSYWQNPEKEDFFISNKLKFSCSGNLSNKSFLGFIYSNLEGDTNNEKTDLYSCYSASENGDKEKTYAIMIGSNTGKPVSFETTDGKEYIFNSMSVNNTYHVYQALKYGTETSKKFGGESGIEKDWFMLTINGYGSNSKLKNSISVLLADYTKGNNKLNYIINKWVTVPLDKLGKVAKVELVLSSSDSKNGIMQTPAYICIDDIIIGK